MATQLDRSPKPVPPSASKAARLRALIEGPALGFLMEAHDGLSAKIAEEAGFEAIWASGLSMSAALGVRDSNEASWTQVLEVLEFMADATGVPTGLKTLAFLDRLKQALAPGGVVAFNVNEHASMADDIAAVAAAFGHAAVYRSPPSDNKVVIAVEGALATDAELRARISALDARFGGALSFAEVLRNRE